MSYTEIYKFGKDGNARLAGEVHNAWRGGMAIWKYLEEKHLPPYIPEYVKPCNWYFPGITAEEVAAHLHYKPTRCMCSEKSGLEELWALADREDLPDCERIALHTTFDYCLVKKADIPKVIEAFREFPGETSLPEQADILEELLADDDCIAVGWNQTSVNADTWSNMNGYDEEKEERIPYNCLDGTTHYWLFKEEPDVQERGGV